MSHIKPQSVKTVLHFVGGLDNRGGVNKYVADLCTLNLPGVSQKVWRHKAYSSPNENDVLQGKVPFTDISSSKDAWGGLQEIAPLNRWIKTNRPCLIHVHSRMGIVTSWFLKRYLKFPLVITLHAFARNIPLYRFLLQTSQATVMFNAIQTCRHFGFPVEDNHIQTPFIPWPPHPPANGNRKRFVAASTFTPVKKIDTLIEAFNLLQKNHQKTELHIFGLSPFCVAPDYQAKIVQMASTSKNIFLHDYTPSWTDFLRTNDIFVHVRPDESFGIVMLEAFAKGLPMVVPANSFLWELDNKCHEGIVSITEISPAGISTAMEEGLKFSALPEDMWFQQRKQAACKFSQEAASRRMGAVYSAAFASHISSRASSN